MHCDTPYECYTKNQEFYVNRLAVSGEGGKEFEKWFQTFAFWIKDNMENPFQFYQKMYSDFKVKIQNKPSNLIPVFSVEGGAVLEYDSDRLFELKKDGTKFLTLTWNGENNIAGGSQSQKGLTSFGKEVIEKMNRLKIGCDLSHLNEKSFYKAVESAEYPMATHSCCKRVFYHPRNLSDEQIRLIAERKGVVGICFYPEFLGGESYSKIYENIYHLLSMGFEDVISIGSDFDGARMSENLQKISQVPCLYEYLAEKGLEKALLQKIFYNNANNFIANLC